MLEEIEEILILTLVLGVIVFIALNWESIKKLASIGDSASQAFDSVKRFYSGTELPGPGKQPGSELAGYDASGNSTKDFVVGGGFGGGGGGAF